MSDMIDRQAAIKAADSIIERDTSGNNDVVKAMTAWKEYIKALPSAQPGWIPVTERLPQNGYWLWSANGGEVKKDFYWDGHWEFAEKYGYEVLAWMPLPKPFEGGQDNGTEQ